MVLSPDTFLLIVISSGVFVIVVGMIVAVNCPYHVLSFTFCFKHCKKLCRRCCCCRKKETNWKHNIINYNYSDRKYGGAALVEGRPQGHGFYTSGAWSSTDTTTTCIDGTIRNSILTADMIGQRFSSTNDDNRNDGETSGGGLPTGTVYGNSDDLILSPGELPTVSNSPLPHAQVCVNCNGIGFVERMAFPTYLNGSSSNNTSTISGDEIRYVHHQPGNHYHYDGGSSSGCLSTGSDLAMASDVDVDADMMMMCM